MNANFKKNDLFRKYHGEISKKWFIEDVRRDEILTKLWVLKCVKRCRTHSRFSIQG